MHWASNCDLLLNEGARLAICARNEETLAQATTELSVLGEVHGHPCDLSNVEQTSNFVDWSSEQLGGLDILVSNVSAGGVSFRGRVETDIMGAQALLRGSLSHRQDGSGANIICIASRATSMGVPFLQSYAALKAATISMVIADAQSNLRLSGVVFQTVTILLWVHNQIMKRSQQQVKK
jgi:3-oxoacyl-[acyl-carrier protein] reductase